MRTAEEVIRTRLEGRIQKRPQQPSKDKEQSRTKSIPSFGATDLEFIWYDSVENLRRSSFLDLIVWFGRLEWNEIALTMTVQSELFRALQISWVITNLSPL